MQRETMVENLTWIQNQINNNEGHIQAQLSLSNGVLSSYPRRIEKRARLANLACFWECDVARHDTMEPMSIAEQNNIMFRKIHKRIYNR